MDKNQYPNCQPAPSKAKHATLKIKTTSNISIYRSFENLKK